MQSTATQLVFADAGAATHRRTQGALVGWIQSMQQLVRGAFEADSADRAEQRAFLDAQQYALRSFEGVEMFADEDEASRSTSSHTPRGGRQVADHRVCYSRPLRIE